MPDAQPIVVNSGSGSGIKWLVGGVLTLTAVYFGKKAYEQYKMGSDLKKDQDSTIKPGKNGKLFNLKGAPIKDANLGTIAAELNTELAKWFPNNDDVVRFFENTPFGYVGKLEKFYLDRYNKNLRAQLVDKLDDTHWIKLKYYFDGKY